MDKSDCWILKENSYYAQNWVNFQYVFRSSRSTADLLIVAFDGIARTFNQSGNTEAIFGDIVLRKVRFK